MAIQPDELRVRVPPPEPRPLLVLPRKEDEGRDEEAGREAGIERGLEAVELQRGGRRLVLPPPLTPTRADVREHGLSARKRRHDAGHHRRAQHRDAADHEANDAHFPARRVRSDGEHGARDDDEDGEELGPVRTATLDDEERNEGEERERRAHELHVDEAQVHERHVVQPEVRRDEDREEEDERNALPHRQTRARHTTHAVAPALHAAERGGDEYEDPHGAKDLVDR